MVEIERVEWLHPRDGRPSMRAAHGTVSWSSSISTKLARTRETWPGVFCMRWNRLLDAKRTPAEQAEAGEPKRDRDLKMAAQEQVCRHRQCQNPPAGRTTFTSTFARPRGTVYVDFLQNILGKTLATRTAPVRASSLASPHR